MALDRSLKNWLHVLKLALRRYGVSPEPRRTWLAVWSLVQNLQELQEAQPGFAATVQRYLNDTHVRVIQDLDTVLTFAMYIQAEVGAIIQDSGLVKDASRKAGASAQAACTQ
eukprot:206525-Amphidinium_carterae.2